MEGRSGTLSWRVTRRKGGLNLNEDIVHVVSRRESDSRSARNESELYQLAVGPYSVPLKLSPQIHSVSMYPPVNASSHTPRTSRRTDLTLGMFAWYASRSSRLTGNLPGPAAKKEEMDWLSRRTSSQSASCASNVQSRQTRATARRNLVRSLPCLPPADMTGYASFTTRSMVPGGRSLMVVGGVEEVGIA